MKPLCSDGFCSPCNLHVFTVFSGEWDNACNELQRMLLVRSLRPDRVSFCATSFIVNNLGSRFVEPPVLDMQQVVDDSTTKTPLIFVLSPGVVCVQLSLSLIFVLCLLVWYVSSCLCPSSLSSVSWCEMCPAVSVPHLCPHSPGVKCVQLSLSLS